MFRPQIQKTHVLVLMALFNIIMVIWALNKKEIDIYNANKMKVSAFYMEEAINFLVDYKYNSIEYQSIGHQLLGGIDSTAILTDLDNDIVFHKDQCKNDPYGYDSNGCIECYDYGEDQCKDEFEIVFNGLNKCDIVSDTTVIDLHGDNFYDAGSDGLLDDRENGCIGFDKRKIDKPTYLNTLIYDEVIDYKSNPDSMSYNDVIDYLSEEDSTFSEIKGNFLLYAYRYQEEDPSVICGQAWWDHYNGVWDRIWKNKWCPSCNINDPNGDNYDIKNNESGTQDNGAWEEGEGTENNDLCEKDENDWNNFLSKTTALKPDLAAVLTNAFNDLGLDTGSVAAISFTGSNPGANIAVLSACKTLGIETRVVSSLFSSRFGATDTSFAWLDMQFKLEESGIFQIDTAMYSKGEHILTDSKKGEVFNKIINRLYIDNSLIIDIDKEKEERIKFYTQNSDPVGALEDLDRGVIDIYINVGWNAISSTSRAYRKAINRTKRKDRMSKINIDKEQVKSELDFFSNHTETDLDLEKEIFYTFLDFKDIHIFHIDKLNYISSVYNLPWADNETGATSSIYSVEGTYLKPNVIMALVLSILNIIIVGVYSYKEMNKRMLSSDPETIL